MKNNFIKCQINQLNKKDQGLAKLIHLKQTSRKLNYFWATLLALSLFLITVSSFKWVWIICTFTLVLVLIKSYQYLLISSSIFYLHTLSTIFLEVISLIHYLIINFKLLIHYLKGVVINFNNVKILIKTTSIFNIGDIIAVQGVISQPQNINNFDLITYLYSHNINHLIDKPQVTLIHAHSSIYILIKEYLHSHFLPLWILLGIKSAKGKAIYSLITKFNLAHLFVISGLHISSIFTIIKGILQRLPWWNEIGTILSLMIVWCLVFWLNFNVSALRGALFVTFIVVNKWFFKNHFKRLDLLSLVLTIMFVIKPYQIFSWSFILSFLATFTLILSYKYEIFEDKYNFLTKNPQSKIKFWSKMNKYFWPLINVYFITLPITLYLNQSWNLCGFFWNIILSPLIISYQLLIVIFLPFSIILSFLEVALINILYGLDYLNLIVQFSFLTPTSLLIIYLLIFHIIVIKKVFISKN